MTERRTKRNLDRLDYVAVEILKLNKDKFFVDSLEDGALKKNLKKVHAKNVQVFRDKHHELTQDSLIILSRHNFMLTFGEIIIDFKKKERQFPSLGGLKKVGPRTYFRKKTLEIS